MKDILKMMLTGSVSDRKCGTCTLCCTLLPVKALKKKDGQRCVHQRSLIEAGGAGCSIYRQPKAGFPMECGLWSCRWLIDPTVPTQRPDAAHYVIDIVPDFITAQLPGSPEIKLPVIQVWCDPNYLDAHEDPKLRKWIVAAEPECAMLVRYDAHDALVMIPPHMSDTGKWEAGASNQTASVAEHSAEEIAAVLHKSGAMK